MRRRLEVLGGVVVLAVVLARVGPDPFVDAVRAAGPLALAAALAVTGVTTLCCAIRWRALGGTLPLREAVATYYRSQFLNATLPGGVVGDVGRAVRHGTLPVVADRGLGQAVQVGAAGTVLLATAWVPGAVVAGLLLLGAAARWPRVVLTSLVASVGHVAVFLVAARAVGSDASLARLLPLAFVVLVAAAIPLSVAGWGPREGVAAWAFAAAGLGAAEGAAVAATYGVLSLVATLPGGLLLLPTPAPRAELPEVARA
ncbi:lysylphosphatidylglycerol synthase domain-containing protein [Nocardioides mangrovi]|uniref:Lysylphosphatidylglycerol synthase domain-containing protein n=1 Tax=Nocardioides mangrovi TaxID=2874580 RepID=A0ABS7UHV7_9ACTN|nr:lysylphosphatidylglycerol synthase domain-containing protein [Nocardioides mangrovi]MBZ5740614.1 lysylphosphatidylglycerol synthase domain-containing protein [Nocardioides mangrovi]